MSSTAKPLDLLGETYVLCLDNRTCVCALLKSVNHQSVWFNTFTKLSKKVSIVFHSSGYF